jgi:hypothetical protein
VRSHPHAARPKHNASRKKNPEDPGIFPENKSKQNQRTDKPEKNIFHGDQNFPMWHHHTQSTNALIKKKKKSSHAGCP